MGGHQARGDAGRCGFPRASRATFSRHERRGSVSGYHGPQAFARCQSDLRQDDGPDEDRQGVFFDGGEDPRTFRTCRRTQDQDRRGSLRCESGKEWLAIGIDELSHTVTGAHNRCHIRFLVGGGRVVKSGSTSQHVLWRVHQPLGQDRTESGELRGWHAMLGGATSHSSSPTT